MTAPTSPGWYDDPEDADQRRYWDGHQWTGHVASKVPAEGEARAAGWFPDPVDGEGMRYWDGAAWTSYTYDPVPDVDYEAPEQASEGGSPEGTQVVASQGGAPTSGEASGAELQPAAPPAAPVAEGSQPAEGFVWAPTTTGWVQVRDGEFHVRHLEQTGSLLVDDLEWTNKKPGIFRDVGHIDFTTPGGSLVQVEYEKANKSRMDALLTALAAEKDNAAIENIVLDAYAAPGLTGADAAGYGANLKKGEALYRVFRGASLVEVKRAQGHFQAGTSSVRFRVMKGVSVGYGGTRGRYVPGPESPTPIDVGDVFITGQRVQFMGSRQSREWAFSKLIGLQESDDGSWTALPVTNRQKVSGIGYGREAAFEVNFWLELALAEYQGRRYEWAQTIERQLRGQVTR